MCFGVLSKMQYATVVNDFHGVLCATISVSCLTKCYDHVNMQFLSSLSSIDLQC